MAQNFHENPQTLPVPEDDKACDHLIDHALPNIPLQSTTGEPIDLAKHPGKTVVFAYPRTGQPGGQPLIEGWNDIPGALGCTPQTCAFRDLHSEFLALGVAVYGLSTQNPEYQAEMTGRLQVPFPVLSDSELRLVRALDLPTFDVKGHVLIKRLTWYAEGGVIQKIFYPVFPPDKNADTVLHWLRDGP